MGSIAIKGSSQPLERTVAAIAKLSSGDVCKCSVSYWTGITPAIVPRVSVYDPQLKGWPLQLFVQCETGQEVEVACESHLGLEVAPSIEEDYEPLAQGFRSLGSGLINVNLLCKANGGFSGGMSRLTLRIVDTIKEVRVFLQPLAVAEVSVIPSRLIATEGGAEFIVRGQKAGQPILDRLSEHAKFSVKKEGGNCWRVRIERWSGESLALRSSLLIPIDWRMDEGGTVAASICIEFF